MYGYGYLCNFEKSMAISANDANSMAIFRVFSRINVNYEMAQ